jgi:hypothetical protein
MVGGAAQREERAMSHEWDLPSNACRHCGATPVAINNGWRDVACEGPNVIGITHLIEARKNQAMIAKLRDQMRSDHGVWPL